MSSLGYRRGAGSTKARVYVGAVLGVGRLGCRRGAGS